MPKKGFLIIILIILAIIVGGYFVLVNKQNKTTSNPQELAPFDFGIADLLIVSVSRGDYCRIETASGSEGEDGVPAEPLAPSQDEECLFINRIPSDSEIVKIESITSYNRNPKAYYEPLQEGSTYNSSFISRPAKFKYITVPGTSAGSDTEASVENLQESGFQGIENDLYVYAFYSDGSLTEAHEVIMPGFKTGDRIRAQIRFSDGNLSIMGYELLQ